MARKRVDSEAVVESAAGGFRSDGSWDFRINPPEDRGPTHSLHWFVDMLVTRRKHTPEAPPSLFVARILASPYQHAFPNLEQWRAINEWRRIGCSTSAEVCVKHCGNVALGHWCGGSYWASGEEKDCLNEHRSERRPEVVQAHTRSIIASLSDDPAEKTTGPQSGPEPRFISDELFFEGRERPLTTDTNQA